MRRLALVIVLIALANRAAADDARAEGLKLLRSTRDLKVALDVMETLATNADANTVDQLFRFVRTEGRRQPAYGLQLERVLRSVREPEARHRVAERGLRSKSIHIRRATAIALGSWGFAEARADLVAIADAELRRGNGRDPALLYEATRALARIGGEGTTEILLRCAQDQDWRARLVAAEFKTTQDLARDPDRRVREAYTGKAEPGSVTLVVETAGHLTEFSMDILRRAAETSITALDDGVAFNVLTFAGQVSIWQPKGPVAASALERRNAAAWLEDQAHPKGACDLWGALERALEGDSVREIRLYACGPPDAGKYVGPEEIALLVRDRNRFSRVKIHVFSLGESELLETIAHDSGGEYKSRFG